MAYLEDGDVRLGGHVPLVDRRSVDRVERDAYLRANRIRSLQFVTQAGLFAATNLTSFERTLADDVPEAANRLAAINAVAMTAIAEEIPGGRPLMFAVAAITVGTFVVALWWVFDDALAAHRERQRQAQRQAVALARINLLNGGARQALREEALLHRLADLDFNRLTDRL